MTSLFVFKLIFSGDFFFFMFTVYVLYSRTHNKIYIGYTSNLNSRLKSHNELATKGWTKKYRPWELLHTETFETKPLAMKREKILKTGRGREFIWNKVKEITNNELVSAEGRT
jgi:putative endonuclease